MKQIYLKIFVEIDFTMFKKLKSLKTEEKKNGELNQSKEHRTSVSVFEKIRNAFKKVEKEEEIKPVGKIGIYARKIQLLNPIGIFKRGYDISIDPKDEIDGQEKKLLVKEKKLSKRIKFILLIMIIQSIPLSFAMTASISLPWTFNVVIPISLDFLPFNLKDLISSAILFIQNILKPLNPLFDIIDTILHFFSTLNPAIFFTGTFWFFDFLGWVNSEKYVNIPDSYNNGSKTSMDILAFNLERKFPVLENMVVPFLLVTFAIISFFFLITKGKKVLFEIMGEKSLKKNKKKLRKPLLSYYMTQGINDFEYIENRSSKQGQIKLLYYLTIVLGVVASFSPMYFALYLIFF